MLTGGAGITDVEEHAKGPGRDSYVPKVTQPGGGTAKK